MREWRYIYRYAYIFFSYTFYLVTKKFIVLLFIFFFCYCCLFFTTSEWSGMWVVAGCKTKLQSPAGIVVHLCISRCLWAAGIVCGQQQCDFATSNTKHIYIYVRVQYVYATVACVRRSSLCICLCNAALWHAGSQPLEIKNDNFVLFCVILCLMFSQIFTRTPL